MQPSLGKIHAPWRHTISSKQDKIRVLVADDQPHVLEAVESGKKLELWFLGTKMRQAIEKELITAVKPPWNVQGKTS